MGREEYPGVCGLREQQRGEYPTWSLHVPTQHLSPEYIDAGTHPWLWCSQVTFSSKEKAQQLHAGPVPSLSRALLLPQLRWKCCCSPAIQPRVKRDEPVPLVAWQVHRPATCPCSIVFLRPDFRDLIYWEGHGHWRAAHPRGEQASLGTNKTLWGLR